MGEKRGVKVIVPDVHIPLWVSPAKARECIEEYLSVLRAKWGDLGPLVVTYIGLYTVREIYQKISDALPNVKLSDVIDVLMDLYERGYIEFEEQ